MQEGTLTVVRQLTERGALSRQNVITIVRNCGKPFRWSELRWAAHCKRDRIVLRTERALLRALQTNGKVPLQQLPPPLRLLARRAQRRLGLIIYQGTVSLNANDTEDALLQLAHKNPGIKLLSLAQEHVTAPAHIALLCARQKLTTHDGRVWANPGPPFDPQAAALWHASII